MTEKTTYLIQLAGPIVQGTLSRDGKTMPLINENQPVASPYLLGTIEKEDDAWFTLRVVDLTQKCEYVEVRVRRDMVIAVSAMGPKKLNLIVGQG